MEAPVQASPPSDATTGMATPSGGAATSFDGNKQTQPELSASHSSASDPKLVDAPARTEASIVLQSSATPHVAAVPTTVSQPVATTAGGAVSIAVVAPAAASASAPAPVTLIAAPSPTPAPSSSQRDSARESLAAKKRRYLRSDEELDGSSASRRIYKCYDSEEGVEVAMHVIQMAAALDADEDEGENDGGEDDGADGNVDIDAAAAGDSGSNSGGHDGGGSGARLAVASTADMTDAGTSLANSNSVGQSEAVAAPGTADQTVSLHRKALSSSPSTSASQQQQKQQRKLRSRPRAVTSISTTGTPFASAAHHGSAPSFSSGGAASSSHHRLPLALAPHDLEHDHLIKVLDSWTEEEDGDDAGSAAAASGSRKGLAAAAAAIAAGGDAAVAAPPVKLVKFVYVTPIVTAGTLAMYIARE